MIYERQIHPIAYPKINTSTTTNCQPLLAIGMMRLMDLENIHQHTHKLTNPQLRYSRKQMS